jgi:hypothetical protein
MDVRSLNFTEAAPLTCGGEPGLLASGVEAPPALSRDWRYRRSTWLLRNGALQLGHTLWYWDHWSKLHGGGEADVFLGEI